jgi:TPP-dependent pyruvate/acetoin dehydrogenase alpha subunit
MHLFSKEMFAASSGILGSSGPAACGFALASQYLKKGKIAVAFFGEGTMNQGMLLESMNLAVVWRLPVIFVCRDNHRAITTVSSEVTGGDLVERAMSFGMPGYEIDGSDVEMVWKIAEAAITDARKKQGPSYIHAHCFRREGHFLGDPLLRIPRHPVREIGAITGSLLRSTTKLKGASLKNRAESLKKVAAIIGQTTKDQLIRPDDPIELIKDKLKGDKQRLENLKRKTELEIEQIVNACIN